MQTKGSTEKEADRKRCVSCVHTFAVSAATCRLDCGRSYSSDSKMSLYSLSLFCSSDSVNSETTKKLTRLIMSIQTLSLSLLPLFPGSRSSFHGANLFLFIVVLRFLCVLKQAPIMSTIHTVLFIHAKKYKCSIMLNSILNTYVVNCVCLHLLSYIKGVWTGLFVSGLSTGHSHKHSLHGFLFFLHFLYTLSYKPKYNQHSNSQWSIIHADLLALLPSIQAKIYYINHTH